MWGGIISPNRDADGDEDQSGAQLLHGRKALVALVPVIGAVTLVVMYAVLLAVVPLSLRGSSETRAVIPKTRRVVVENRCSRAVQVGWLASDTAVPVTEDVLDGFFGPAVYVEGERWPQVDPYGIYANQTGVIPPGDSWPMEVRDDAVSAGGADRAGAPEVSFVLVSRVFSPKDGGLGGNPASEMATAPSLDAPARTYEIASSDFGGIEDADGKSSIEGAPVADDTRAPYELRAYRLRGGFPLSIVVEGDSCEPIDSVGGSSWQRLGGPGLAVRNSTKD